MAVNGNCLTEVSHRHQTTEYLTITHLEHTCTLNLDKHAPLQFEDLLSAIELSLDFLLRTAEVYPPW